MAPVRKLAYWIAAGASISIGGYATFLLVDDWLSETPYRQHAARGRAIQRQWQRACEASDRLMAVRGRFPRTKLRCFSPIDLSDCSTDELDLEALAQLGDALDRHPSLDPSLDLRLGPNIGSPVAKALAALPHLRSLDLNGARLTIEDMQQIKAAHPNCKIGVLDSAFPN